MAEQGIWRMRINEKLRGSWKDLDILTDIKKKRLEWIGHVVRMDQGSRVKKMFESKPKGSRRRGKPRFRWLVDVEKDLREMKFKKWRQKAVDREEWSSVRLLEGRRAKQ